MGLRGGEPICTNVVNTSVGNTWSGGRVFRAASLSRHAAPPHAHTALTARHDRTARQPRADRFEMDVARCDGRRLSTRPRRRAVRGPQYRRRAEAEREREIGPTAATG
eukprot:861518-Pleurochrysis_carterae.AAC.3